ncbi:MAG: 5-(carboxyamino)imidazole ribonucleotide synthase [Planctomycetota bacterium]|nr:5-(carboxyamino)imidazole ribonucleotide synthase [Planctomycetota bacterium]
MSAPLNVADTIGVLGAGQLGRMLALAGARLGFRFRFLDVDSSACARGLGEFVPARPDHGGFQDVHALERFAEAIGVATYEFENVPVAAADRLLARVPVLPGPLALATCQDRLNEKNMFARVGVQTPPFATVDSLPELHAAIVRIGLPAVLKARRLGYDGKGQAVLRSPADAEQAWRVVGQAPSILETFVPFQRELSMIAVRGRTGELRTYPLVENVHRAGILRLSRAPAPQVSPEIEQHARHIAMNLLEAMDYVGVLAIEFFEHEGRLLPNEMAPRVHNSGHWTMDGATTCQFENHIRAIAGLPLGDTTMREGQHAGMVNLIGAAPPLSRLAACPGARIHMYDKSPRPGRKIGHVNVVASTPAARDASIERIASMIEENSSTLVES